MPRVLPSELNGCWFKMKSEKRCEVNEFHTPVSLKTLFWPSSHSDWGWRVGNRAMLIRRSQKGVLWCYALPYTCEFTEQGCSRAETFFLLFFSPLPFCPIICGWPECCELFNSVTSHYNPDTRWPHSHKHRIFHTDSRSMLALIVFLLLELSHQWWWWWSMSCLI